MAGQRMEGASHFISSRSRGIMAQKSSRIPPLAPEDFTDEQAELAGGRGSARGELNIVRLLVQNPALYRAWMPFGMHGILSSSLSARHREIVVLHTCSLCGGSYDVAQHRVIAQRAGLSAADIEAAINDGTGLAAFERILIDAVNELLADRCISDVTYAALAEHYTRAQLLDLVFAVGNYTLMSMTTKTFDVQVEPNIESGWKPN
jgi:4-carboxymuconolactone decarboxylase